MIAARSGRTDITNVLLEGKHIDLDIQEKRTGWSALHFSVERGDSATTEALLKAGANPHLKDKDGDTAVIMAVKSHEPDTLRELVRAGSDLNLQNNEGLTPLMIAARSERTDITNILLEGEHINLDIQEECTGLSALHFSADRGDSATTEALLKAGANLHLNDKDGDSALTLAAWCGHTNFVVKLVKAGADLDLQNKNGDTAVIMAVKRHEPATLRELVRAGSDLNLQNQEGLTPLMIAARSGRTDITNILLEGKHINLDIQEKRTGRSALHFSAEERDSATTEALLKAGANPHLKDKNGATAMEITEQRAQSSLVSKTLPMRVMMTQPSLYDSQRAVRHLKSESKDTEGDDTSSMLALLKSESKDLEGDYTSSSLTHLTGQELESEGNNPTAGQQSQIRKEITP
ncbi:Putative ankyrin repeat protein MM_0045, partial [Geodia barretti]